MLLDILMMVTIMIPRRNSHLHWQRLFWLEIGERRGCGGGGDLEVKFFSFRLMWLFYRRCHLKGEGLWLDDGLLELLNQGWRAEVCPAYIRGLLEPEVNRCQGDLYPWPFPYCLVYFLFKFHENYEPCLIGRRLAETFSLLHLSLSN